MTKTNQSSENSTKWYQYLAGFFAGAILVNAIPHFINGILGQQFPTPFADPPTVGLSSPVINTIWALCNIFVGYLFFRASNVHSKNKLGLLVFFTGIVVFSITFSILMTNRGV